MFALGVPVAAQPASPRLVLAIDDVELRRAFDAELAPWHVTIVTARVPADATDAEAIASSNHARYIVWRERDDLVVYDLELRLAARRKTSAGAFDTTSAASAAASVKTLLRLPPLEAAAVPSSTAAVDSRIGLRLELDAAARRAASTEARFGAHAMLRPWRSRGWWFGIAGELGTSTNIQNAGFKGSWSDWSVLATAAYSFELTSMWALDPFVGIGVTHSVLDGSEQMSALDDTTALLELQAGIIARAHIGRWSAGGGVWGGFLASPPTYTTTQGNAMVFAVPTYELTLGIVIGTEILQ